MRTKINKVAKDLNVGVSTAVEFLRKHNIVVDESQGPNARIDQDAVDLLTKEFSKDKNIKAESDKFISRRNDKKASKPERPKTDEIKTATPGLKGPRILGTVDLNNPGHVNAPEPKQQPKPEPKPELKSEPKPEIKVEPKPQPKPEPKPEPKVEPKAEPKPQPKA
ncbi:MAG: translation initiation factor IF-2, partial [Muribaculaceae bacterium]|nr:translation initiation factor IF-2 [Muribaculaceae bacterium]